MPGPWRVAFARPHERTDCRPLRHVLLGINAHINYDLPQALLAVISPADFDDPVLIRVAAGRPPAHRRGASRRVGAEDEARPGSAPRSLTDAARPANQAASRRFLAESREKVWHNAVALNAARPAVRPRTPSGSANWNGSAPPG